MFNTFGVHELPQNSSSKLHLLPSFLPLKPTRFFFYMCWMHTYRMSHATPRTLQKWDTHSSTGKSKATCYPKITFGWRDLLCCFPGDSPWYLTISAADPINYLAASLFHWTSAVSKRQQPFLTKTDTQSKCKLSFLPSKPWPELYKGLKGIWYTDTGISHNIALDKGTNFTAKQVYSGIYGPIAKYTTRSCQVEGAMYSWGISFKTRVRIRHHWGRSIFPKSMTIAWCRDPAE